MADAEAIHPKHIKFLSFAKVAAFPPCALRKIGWPACFAWSLGHRVGSNKCPNIGANRSMQCSHSPQLTRLPSGSVWCGSNIRHISHAGWYKSDPKPRNIAFSPDGPWFVSRRTARDSDMNASRAIVRLACLVLLCTVVRLSFLTSSAFASPCSRPSGGLSVPALHAESSALPNPKPHRYGSCNLALLALGLSALALRPQMTKTTRVQRFAGFGGSGLSGKWGCYKTEGDIDGYWKATGLPWLARKGLQLMDWGAGKNQNIREFSQKADDIEMEYSFQGPGLGALGFTEKYKVGNGTQVITRMGGAKILVDPVWESDSVLRVT